MCRSIREVKQKKTKKKKKDITEIFLKKKEKKKKRNKKKKKKKKKKCYTRTFLKELRGSFTVKIEGKMKIDDKAKQRKCSIFQ